MSYTLHELAANPKNVGGARTAGQIRYLVFHYTGNDGDTAAGNAAYFARSVVEASAHYFVDDTTVYRSVPDLRTAWAVGGRRYASADETGGGSLYGAVTNTNSLSIEMCGTLGGGTRTASEATLANAAALGRKLMAKYGIPPERVCRHFDVTGKLCPAYLVDGAAWAAFKRRLEEDEVVRYKYLNEVPETFRPAISALMDAGIIQGDGSDPGGNGDVIDLSHDQVRLLVMAYRGGAFDRRLGIQG